MFIFYLFKGQERVGFGFILVYYSGYRVFYLQRVFRVSLVCCWLVELFFWGVWRGKMELRSIFFGGVIVKLFLKIYFFVRVDFFWIQIQGVLLGFKEGGFYFVILRDSVGDGFQFYYGFFILEVIGEGFCLFFQQLYDFG